MRSPYVVRICLMDRDHLPENINTRLYFLFQGEPFVPPTLAPEPVKTGECLPSYGIDYTGDLAVTMGGHACLQWSSSVVKTLSQDKEFIPEVSLPGNKCRNPDNDPEGPWCYVMISGNVTIDYCDVELCGKNTTSTHSLQVLVLLVNALAPPVCLPLRGPPGGRRGVRGGRNAALRPGTR